MRLMQFGFALPGRGPLATPEALTKLAEKADAHAPRTSAARRGWRRFFGSSRVA